MEPQSNPTGSEKPDVQSENTAATSEPAVTPAVAVPAETPAATPGAPDIAATAPVQPAGSEAGLPPVAGSAVTVSGSGRKKRWVLPAIITVVLLALIGGGYVFGFYLPNRPSAVFTTGLKRSGEAVDALVTYMGTTQSKHYKSWDASGDIHSTGSAAFDGTLQGSFGSNGNADFHLSADVLGEKFSAETRSVRVNGDATPDIYVQVSGIKHILDSYGLNDLDSLDGQWIGIDHTLLDSYAASLNQSASNAAKSSTVPSAAQIHDAASKVQAVNKQYLFTTDSSKAVLANAKYIGKQTKDGRSTYHYTVGYNKAHLQAYISALSTALNSSSLNTWSRAANDGQNISQLLALNDLKDSVAKAGAGYTFNVWVDAETKLLHAVQFTNPADDTVYTFSQNYVDGATYPFEISVNSKDPANGETQSGVLNIAINTSTGVLNGGLAYVEGKTSNVKLNFTMTPSETKTVQVSAPVNYKPLGDILGRLGVSQNGL